MNNNFDFAVASHIPTDSVGSVEMQISSGRGFANLSDAAADIFGSDYANVFLGSAVKYYNGQAYGVVCRGTQSTQYSSFSSTWFAQQTAVTAIVAWAVVGSWTWQALLVDLICSVVNTILSNGLRVTINNLNAERCNVIAYRTRNVYVNGLNNSMYWANHTQECYFFKGDYNWTHDTGNHAESKNTDFDDISSLMESGFDNYVYYYLS